ncbi:hypothetical protein HUW51_08600 [Adhaeribacter swui]|uniref:Right-handed parallel beta-helix repeat-containing protein n=1 Tax=Adhaeribacter swui TaxID=2086471 RepID=A0A7G7G6K4_9BACT|nr:hypothetical protein [Adhaeribacter swui]QNF32788.1 hypothetical protein HUW51_08600 [Adhaeribacter swui]
MLFQKTIQTFKTKTSGRLLVLCFFISWTLYSLTACEPKEDIITTDPAAKLEFSTDSVKFDTVFVNTSSASRAVWVYNRQNKAVKISEIKLAQGNNAYQLTIDGQETNHASNVLVRGRDSLLVLVKAKIPTTTDTTAFILTDAITFLTNANRQQIPVVSYGQNAYFHTKAEITTNAIWKADKPHVVNNFVRVKTGVKLAIEKGAKIYFGKDAALFIHGSLQVNGTHNQRVAFKGIRRELFYASVPGQWQGIKFEATSQNNSIHFADIKNATYGLWAANPDRDETDYDLEINQTVIQNMFETGIRSHGADVRAINSLITNCGQSAVLGLGGGNYQFIYCTLANYTVGFRPETLTMHFSDRLKEADQPNQDYRVKLLVQNSIIWSGKRSNSTFPDQIRINNEAGTTPQLELRNSVLQTVTLAEHPAFNCCSNLLNIDPKFKAPTGRLEVDTPDFRLDTLSPVSNKAMALPEITKDLDNINRHATTPDPGAYERTKE